MGFKVYLRVMQFIKFICRYVFLRYYYYTAGTGGAGPTILATSFLLLGEEVVAYNKGMFLLAELNQYGKGREQ